MTLFTLTSPNLLRDGVTIDVIVAPPIIEYISGPSSPISITAEIDTAAMHTYIQEGLATSLGLQPVKTVKVTSATKVAYEAYMYRIGLYLDDENWLEVNAIEVPYMLRPHTRIQCILGRDVLQHCILIYNGRTNVATLEIQCDISGE